MIKISSERSLRLSALSFLGTVLVVFLHSYSKPLSNSMSGSFTWWLQDLMSQGFCRVAVPYFFVAFGLMLFKDLPTEERLSWWIGKLRSRTRSLLIPYLFWSLIGTVSLYILTRFAEHRLYSFDVSNMDWWLQVLGIVSMPKYMFHLWFVRALIVFVLTMPIWGSAIIKVPSLSLIILFACSFIKYPVIGAWAENLFFVGLGGALAVKKGDWLERIESLNSVPLTFAWVLCVIIKVVMTRFAVTDIYGITWCLGTPLNLMLIVNLVGLIAFYALGHQIASSCLERHLSMFRMSFFIYCIHWTLMGWCGACASRVVKFAYGSSSEFLNWFLPPLLVLVLSLVIAMSLSIRCPKIYQLLSGGR